MKSLKSDPARMRKSVSHKNRYQTMQVENTMPEESLPGGIQHPDKA
jgi:hypothetical protein